MTWKVQFILAKRRKKRDQRNIIMLSQRIKLYIILCGMSVNQFTLLRSYSVHIHIFHIFALFIFDVSIFGSLFNALSWCTWCWSRLFNPVRRRKKSTSYEKCVQFPPWLTQFSHKPLRRTGSFAAATITAALTIWVTRSSDVLQTLFVSLSYIIYQTLRSSRWSTIHRKQLYQRSPAHSAPHAPSHPPSSPPLQAPSPSRRPRTTHHPPASATTTLAISGGSVQEAWMCRRVNGSLEARRRRQRSQSSPRRRRRRRRGRGCPDRRCCDVTIRQALPVATAVPSPPLPSLHRCHRLLLRWSWLQQPRITNITIDRPGVSLRTSAS